MNESKRASIHFLFIIFWLNSFLIHHFFGKPRLKSNNPKAAKVEQTIFWTHLVEGEIVILKNTRYLYLWNKKKWGKKLYLDRDVDNGMSEREPARMSGGCLTNVRVDGFSRISAHAGQAAFLELAVLKFCSRWIVHKPYVYGAVFSLIVNISTTTIIVNSWYVQQLK